MSGVKIGLVLHAQTHAPNVLELRAMLHQVVAHFVEPAIASCHGPHEQVSLQMPLATGREVRAGRMHKQSGVATVVNRCGAQVGRL